ncbi:hydroxymethylglutaryl-CoA lyase [Shinella yambaruensis]|uniref:Hydroxymethylglutaryl-CoA lyase n=1 Tax=Shinella yambaruensis TaxID=415996 RepID=A0ABQ5ZC13_9HYPH|nr:hydroxymethylglutaryl-CoA lyase [Shinella yambaruensis]MCJ8026015.1 hydroxymethylglutaryl-CoA lyase [Shinella yambaruensis]MCU7978263.1 hydroxymethylglutaryl-CoA lyase [Shinella yambaruensis]GLR50335.1 hydroxymethylglutaryl-CoA lyase [Shinella yambaruensis]
MSRRVEIVEMAARDGLQNEKAIIPAADKIALIDRLSDCGFRRIEATSFVSPKWVPQLADGAEVMAGIARRPGVSYAALVPNMKGYEAAKAAGVDEVAVFLSASEGFSRANLNCSIAESIERARPVADAARVDGIPLRGYVSCVVQCPYDGPVEPSAVARVTGQLLDLGCHEVSLGDTIGRARPEEVAAMLAVVTAAAAPERLAGHFHDTGGMALDNIRVALDHGLAVFDASVGGLGGCPYAPGARGNVDTLAVADMLAGQGYETGLDRTRLLAAAAFARRIAGKETPGARV